MEHIPQDGAGLIIVISPAVALGVLALIGKLAWQWHARQKSQDAPKLEDRPGGSQESP